LPQCRSAAFQERSADWIARFDAVRYHDKTKAHARNVATTNRFHDVARDGSRRRPDVDVEPYRVLPHAQRPGGRAAENQVSVMVKQCSDVSTGRVGEGPRRDLFDEPAEIRRPHTKPRAVPGQMDLAATVGTRSNLRRRVHPALEPASGGACRQLE